MSCHKEASSLAAYFSAHSDKTRLTVATVLDSGHPEDPKIAEEDFEAIDQEMASATPQELARLEQPTELRRTQPISFA